MDDLSREKFNLHRIQFMTNPYCFPCFSERSAASLLYTTVAAGPSPPDVEKINGVKEPCSMSLIH